MGYVSLPEGSSHLFLPCNSNKQIGSSFPHLEIGSGDWIPIQDSMASKRVTICGLLVLMMETSIVFVISIMGT